MTISVNDWSETPASNTSIDTVSIAEGTTSIASVNNALRAIMAGVRTFKVAYDAGIGSLSSYVTAAAGVFSGTQPKYTSEGAFLHHNASGYASGRIFVQASGGTAPAMQAGDILLEY